MKNSITLSVALFLSTGAFSQKVGIDASTLQFAKFTVEQTAGSTSSVEQILWNRANDFTRLKFRNNSLGFWELGARIGSLSNPSQDTFKITTDLEPNFFVMRGNGQIGINTGNPLFRLHIEGTNRPGVFARTTNASTDSGAIMGILDVPSGASFRSSGVRGESKSITSNSIGVYGIQNGGGWGVAGSVKEAGASGWGAGVYGEAGLNGFSSGTGGYGVYGLNANTGGTGGYFRDFSGAGKALVTVGAVQFVNLGGGTNKVLTSDATGNATWQNLPASAGVWNVTGNDIQNGNTGIVRIGQPNVIGFDSKLTVASNSNTINGTLALHENESDYARLQFSNQNSAGNNYWHLAGFNDNVTINNDRFNIYHGLTGDIMSITGDGKVGIGTTNPTQKLELNNGFLKVSGANKTAFIHTAEVANISGNLTYLNYSGMASTDIVIVSHVYVAAYTGPVGVWWVGSGWAIFRENNPGVMPAGEKFSVMVIKQ
ncbi:MAG: hypothetical protein V4722_23155 [Bacteroidota bacterium]